MKHIVRQYLRQADLSRCSRESVAAHLLVSRSHVQRQLCAEGTTYQALLDNERKRRLKALDGMPAKRIAPELGFSQANSFCRWYRWQTGRNISGRAGAG